ALPGRRAAVSLGGERTTVSRHLVDRKTMARIVNRRELRAQHDAYEAREQDRQPDDEDVDAEDEEEEASAEAEEEAPKEKKAKPAKEAKPKRSRAAKVVRQRLVWVVFDNSNKRIGEPFPYPQKQAAEDKAAQLSAEKKSTYFVQPVKEPME